MKWYWGIGSSQCFIGKKDALPEATHEGYANTSFGDSKRMKGEMEVNRRGIEGSLFIDASLQSKMAFEKG